MIDLSNCQSVKSAEAKSGKKNALEVILKNDSFLMHGSTEHEKDEWIGQLGRAIVKSSGMFVEEDNGEDDNDDDDELDN